MIGKYKLAHIGGKTRGNEIIFRSCEKYLTMKGWICFAPVFYSLEDYYKAPEMLDDMLNSAYAMHSLLQLRIILENQHLIALNNVKK